MTGLARKLSLGILAILLSNGSTVSVLAQEPDHQSKPEQATGTGVPIDLATFDKIKELAGEWEATLADGSHMINIFTPFALGTKVFAQEWSNGKYITSTIFYMVGSELRADHFCDFKNEPRYVIKVSAAQPSVLHFELRDATNLDVYPVHFHSTTWNIVDNNHLIQDWYIEGDNKPRPKPVHMEFARKPLSLRPDGSPVM